MKYASILILCLLSINCATKSAFLYEHPQNDLTGKKKLQYAVVEDMRGAPPAADDSDMFKVPPIDQNYETKIVDEIGLAIKSEVESLPTFDTATQVSGPITITAGIYTLNAQLLKYEWVVPEYSSMLNKVFIISLFTGGIGGVIYGLTGTTASGTVSLAFKVYDDKRKLIIDKTYTGNYVEEMNKMSCDSPKTKARVTAKALADVLAQFKADLK